MKRRLRLLTCLALALLAACTGVPSPAAAPGPTATPAPFTLRILHTNDTWGYLHPCG